jgi:phosphoenolpyruvate-protein kinase (PTS system EI component)
VREFRSSTLAILLTSRVGSQEEPTAKHFQEIAGADSDESDAVSAGSAKVGKKCKRKETQKVEGETHWQELITEATHRMQNDANLSETTLEELRKTKEHAEAQLELVKARTRDVDGETPSDSLLSILI